MPAWHHLAQSRWPTSQLMMMLSHECSACMDSNVLKRRNAPKGIPESPVVHAHSTLDLLCTARLQGHTEIFRAHVCQIKASSYYHIQCTRPTIKAQLNAASVSTVPASWAPNCIRRYMVYCAPGHLHTTFSAIYANMATSFAQRTAISAPVAQCRVAPRAGTSRIVAQLNKVNNCGMHCVKSEPAGQHGFLRSVMPLVRF